VGYPRELDEYTQEELHKEYMRRARCKGLHECAYCGKRLDSGHACKLNEHKTPMPAHVATEAVLQGLAAHIDNGLPSGRGFVLSVVHTAEGGPEGSFGSYVSNLPPAVVPEHLRETALYIEEREKKRRNST
jgi:hypothetical protein